MHNCMFLPMDIIIVFNKNLGTTYWVQYVIHYTVSGGGGGAVTVYVCVCVWGRLGGNWSVSPILFIPGLLPSFPWPSALLYSRLSFQASPHTQQCHQGAAGSGGISPGWRSTVRAKSRWQATPRCPTHRPGNAYLYTYICHMPHVIMDKCGHIPPR